jgi:CheY-like chemotaxis protein
MTEKINILWVDDEIELLKPHIMFLEKKSYAVSTANNGNDALDMIANHVYDIIFLDEQMPGLSGIETLERIKKYSPFIPVVMITKSEEERIMEEAIGSQIADYLIKPVNPSQILLSLKKNLENKKLISEKTTQLYQQSFGKLSMEIGNNPDYVELVDIYKRLVRWEISLQQTEDDGINEILKMQKEEANTVFAKYLERHYEDWINNRDDDKPVFSHTLFREKLFPVLKGNKPVFLLLIDNLRYDQWKFIQPLIQEKFSVATDDIFFSILPTTTQYSRNAMFAGLMPLEIQRKYPQWWLNENDEGGKNQFEKELLAENLKRYGYDSKFSYHKVLNLSYGKKLVENLPNLMHNPLNVIVYNFIDMLSHARTEMEIIKELADDEKAYRSLTLSWFEHSQLYEIFEFLSEKDVEVIITTDHGSVRVDNPVKVVGDKFTNTNLRYKTGKTLSYNPKDVYALTDPYKVYLPKENVSSRFIFSKKNDFFVYPNNMNYYTNYYKNTFQHGGISMEEVLIPYIHLKPKG